MCDDAGTIVFVEVRARADGEHGTPEETVGAVKRARVVRAARLWLLAREIDERDVACRFDVVAVEGDQLRHHPGAFSATAEP